MYELSSLPKRMQAKIRVSETGCWEWQGALKAGGYGATRWLDEQRVHRAAYKHFCGEIADGLVMDHLCRNRLCCNPEHLEPVTIQENNQRGNRAKLTPDDVVAIREAYATRTVTLQHLADQFNVTVMTVHCLVTGKTWSNIGGPITPKDRRRPSEATKQQIRELYATGRYSHRELAREFGVAHTAIGRYVNG